MSVKFTLNEIREIVEPVKKLAAQDLPIRISWRLSKFIEEIEKHLEKIEEFRVSLVKKHGTMFCEKEVEPGKFEYVKMEESDNVNSSQNQKIEVEQCNMDGFLKDFFDLLKEEVTIDIEPFDISILDDNIKLSAKDLSFLKKIIK